MNFILVTVDPELSNGRPGVAFDLVQWRLSRHLWPLYKRTRNRTAIAAGARVAFYVGGSRRLAGNIIATANAQDLRRQTDVDPPNVLSDPASIVLSLHEVRQLKVPIRFRDVLPDLSIAPKNMSKWGVVLHGGSRRLTDADWAKLFESSL